MKRRHEKGIIIVLVLVFAAVFGLSVSALTTFIFMQAKLSASKEIREQAFGIAEAGLEYYHWFLAHYPNNLKDGTSGSGPYVHTYTDPQGGTIGSFSLDIVGNKKCGEIQSIDITSTGTVASDPAFKRTVSGRHAAPSVAEYAYIIGENVWAGSDRNITGPYHSNGGVRMDGTNNSVVTSGVATWTCPAGDFGCTTNQTVNGVFGDGPNSNLWQFPVSTISFSNMAASFSNLKSKAVASGIYLAPYSTTVVNYQGYLTAQNGYRLLFRSDGTVDIYRVTATTGYWGYRSGIEWTPDFHIISSETYLGRQTIPVDCPVIFVEDKTWIQGAINGKVTVVTADLVNSNFAPDVIIRGDLTYATEDGTSGLTVISEGGIFIPPQSQNNLTLNGIFVAQGDRFGRPYYENDVKNSLTIHGSIVSKNRVGTSWTCDTVICSGYQNRYNSYDRLQTTNPPPYTPSYTTTHQYILWQEE